MARRSRFPLSAPEPLRLILARAGENRFARTRDAIPPAVWRDAVGARIAERAFPISLEEGTLLLRVPTSVWANELSFLADEICGRLKERGVVVRELRFRVGAVPTVERPPERRTARAVPVIREIPEELAHVLSAVTDPELRQAIERAAAANLAWQSVTRPAPPAPLTEAQRAVRAPRSAGAESAPPARRSPASPGAQPGTREDGRRRSR
jgi:Dna[CI] antecedent, DciA